MECILPWNSNIKAFYDVILINFNRHAYYFLKCISHKNQSHKSSHRHLWGINWDNFFSGQWVQKIHGQVLNYQYPEVTGYFRNLFATWTWFSYRIRYLKDRTGTNFEWTGNFGWYSRSENYLIRLSKQRNQRFGGWRWKRAMILGK